MKRDMELIRALMLKIEGDAPDDFTDLTVAGYNDDQVNLHLTLLLEAGLAHGQVVEQGMGQTPQAIVDRLTWQGYEFLDNARNEAAWKQVTGKAKAAGATLSLEVLKTLLSVAVKAMLGG